MILAKEFNRSSIARDADLTVSTSRSPSAQPPTILQFGANSPVELSRASRLAAPDVNGVDLNCGCPQSWACAETLGAALMNQRELVRDLVVETRKGLREDGWDVGGDDDMESSKGRSVSVKIRIHDDLRYVYFERKVASRRLMRVQENDGLDRHSGRRPKQPQRRLANNPPSHEKHSFYDSYTSRRPPDPV